MKRLTKTFGICEICKHQWDIQPDKREDALVTMLRYMRAAKYCGVCGDIPSEKITIEYELTLIQGK